jgi:hypothetical protein
VSETFAIIVGMTSGATRGLAAAGATGEFVDGAPPPLIGTSSTLRRPERVGAATALQAATRGSEGI